MNTTTTTLADRVANSPARSAWSRGVRTYALEMIDLLQQEGWEPTETNLLNGARNWKEASYGGSFLIFDGDICERLSSPSEARNCRNGQRAPNCRETWLDCQARALKQAARLVMRLTGKA